MPILKYLKNLKNFSIIILPDDTSHEARSHKFNSIKILIFLIAFSIFMSIASYYFFNLTGIGHKVLPGNFHVRTEEQQKVETLNEKIIFLATEIQKLKSTNQRLKYALVLGDTVLADSLGVDLDSVEQYYEYPAEGNILSIVLKFFSSENESTNPQTFFILPANGYISREFDLEKGHTGLDISVKNGSPVYAAASGFVVFAGYTIEDGNVMIINHSDGYISIYKHCSLLLKKEREAVEQGELIAKSGNSGLHSSGPHLHFEIWKDGNVINPQSVLIKNK
jgi:murein DD-endopeptidase MepM/ murein hydrolase activator NlpD